MDEGELVLRPGDSIALANDPHMPEVLSVRLCDAEAQEPARWLCVDFVAGPERDTKINELIYALERLRDHKTDGVRRMIALENHE